MPSADTPADTPESEAAAAVSSPEDRSAAEATRAAVAAYYGEALSSSGDLKTSACATSAAPPPALAALVANLHEETRARYFGCGLIAPEALEGCSVLDLGCGAGRDVYVLSQLVGAQGRVVGVDMTEQQLAVAERWREWHRDRFGHAQSNVAFHRGVLEDLDAVGLAPGGFDVIVSNCVLNLATDKAAVLAGARRLLKPGGEFYFADVYADRPLPAAAANDPVLYGECLGGALVWSDFVRLAEDAGFAPPRLTAAAPIGHYSPELARAVGETRFVSATVRLFAAPAEQRTGAARVSYVGGADALDAGGAFDFDLETRFEPGAEARVDAETAALIRGARFADLFEIEDAGDAAAPYRPLDPFAATEGRAAPTGAGCC